MTEYLKDLSERVLTTAAFAFLSAFSLTDMSSLKAAGLAAGAAALSLVKGALASQIGDGSAGLK